MRIIFHVLKIASIILLVSLGSLSCFAGPDWDGTYSYESAQGNTVGGSSIVMKYVLVISSQDCSLSIDGFQTMDRIKCTANAEKSTLHIRFKSYENGAVENEFGVQVYKVGQVLFDLTRSGAKITTTWQGEVPDEKLPRTGTYFMRVSNTN